MRFKTFSLALALLGLVVTGCDYGVAWEEQEGDFYEDPAAVQGALGTEQSGVDLTLPYMLQLDPSMHPDFGTSPEHLFGETQESEGAKDEFCDCSEMCAACADAYICGHESQIAAICGQCAKCQQECTSTYSN